MKNDYEFEYMERGFRMIMSEIILGGGLAIRVVRMFSTAEVLQSRFQNSGDLVASCIDLVLSSVSCLHAMRTGLCTLSVLQCR